MSEGARLATTDDLDVIAGLAEAAAIEQRAERGGAVWAVREARAAITPNDLRDLIGTPTGLALAGTFDGAVVGYALAVVETLRDGSRLAVLSDLYVEPMARGVGVGEALMDAVVVWAERQGCRGIDAIALPGNREAKNFFERAGLTARAILVHRPLGRRAEGGDDAGPP